MVNGLFTPITWTLNVLERGLAWIDFGIHYISGYLLYYLLRGFKPQWHTRPRKGYSPAVLVTGASQGESETIVYMET